MFPKERQRRVSWDLQSKVRIVCVCLFWTGLLIRRAELLKINHYKAPRDKMICILNCCKVIFGQSPPWLVSPAAPTDSIHRPDTECVWCGDRRCRCLCPHSHLCRSPCQP